MFGRKKSQILAPINGKILPITETPDSVFSDKVLGDGVAIDPADGTVLSPVSGTVANVAHTFHAVCIEADDGAEVLLHLGMDTVEMDGKGFTCFVKQGEHVAAGQKLMEMDLSLIRKEGHSVISPCIITNLDQIKKLKTFPGEAEAGKTVAITYEP